jgi:D-cysteine desulfhydrase family pyridoxal phosphate-dependent enzyme
MESTLKSIPRLKFAHLPTPIEALPRLSAALGGLRLFVKRDDQTGLALGGNKTRKLEFLLAEAQANGARTLITAGAVQSNHCRQTAAAAARHGFDCTLVLTGQPEASLSGNLLLDHLLGANLIWTDRSQRDAILKQTFDDAWQSGRRPFLIPYGGSSPTGALGYAFALQEMLEQAPSSPMGSPPDWIVFPTSSGGTHAGLALGAKAFGFSGKVLGISIDETAADLQQHVSTLASQAADLLGEPLSFSPEDILVNDSYLGQGYGIAAGPEREAMLLFARTEGLLLDPVYTGRAAAGLVDLTRRGFFSSTDRVLFWHTGGAPALFAGRYQGLLE